MRWRGRGYDEAAQEDGIDIAHPGGSSLAGRESDDDDDGYVAVETLCTDIEPAMRNIDKTDTPPARHRYTKTAARTHARYLITLYMDQASASVIHTKH